MNYFSLLKMSSPGLQVSKEDNSGPRASRFRYCADIQLLIYKKPHPEDDPGRGIDEANPDRLAHYPL